MDQDIVQKAPIGKAMDGTGSNKGQEFPQHHFHHDRVELMLLDTWLDLIQKLLGTLFLLRFVSHTVEIIATRRPR